MTAVSLMREDYPLDMLMRVSGMSRSTYFYRLGSIRRKQAGSGVDSMISEIFHTSREEYGCRKISAALERYGVHMNFKTVSLRMRRLGLVSRYRRKRHRRTGGASGYAPNVLNRQFRSEEPLRKLVTDVTEFRTLGRKLYLSPIMDLHDNRVLAYGLSTRNSWELVGEMLRRLDAGCRLPENVVIHSDQGALYRSREYLRFAQEHKVVRSMSGRGSCYDNAVIESYFGHLKSYLGRLDRVPTEEAARRIEEAVAHFNGKRIMLKLGGLTPDEYSSRSRKERKEPEKG